LRDYSVYFLRYFKTYCNKGYLLFAILFLLFSIQIFAQDRGKQLAKADKSFEALAYINARNIYLDVAQQGYSSPDLYRK